MTYLLAALARIHIPQIPMLTILWVSLWLRISTIGAELKSLKRGFQSLKLRRESERLSKLGPSLLVKDSVYSRSFEKPLPPQLSSSQPSSQLSRN